MRKYQPLADYLVALPPETARVTLRLAEIERLLREPLSRTALTSTWWQGADRQRPTPVWQAAGWRVAGCAFRTTTPAVTFERLSSRLSGR